MHCCTYSFRILLHTRTHTHTLTHTYTYTHTHTHTHIQTYTYAHAHVHICRWRDRSTTSSSITSSSITACTRSSTTITTTTTTTTLTRQGEQPPTLHPQQARLHTPQAAVPLEDTAHNPAAPHRVAAPQALCWLPLSRTPPRWPLALVGVGVAQVQAHHLARSHSITRTLLNARQPSASISMRTRHTRNRNRRSTLTHTKDTSKVVLTALHQLPSSCTLTRTPARPHTPPRPPTPQLPATGEEL